MGLLELFLVGLGLSMDAFAVSICKGLNMRRINYKHSFIIAAFFGFFQAAMPLIGWTLGIQFEQYIVSFDHWVAFFLLGLVGGKMVKESFAKNEDACDCSQESKLDIKELFIMSIATSIDALAVGITLALMPNTDIWLSIGVIGIVTFAMCVMGVIVGNNFGSRYKNKAEFAGGLILIAIGTKILVEHLGLF